MNSIDIDKRKSLEEEVPVLKISYDIAPSFGGKYQIYLSAYSEITNTSNYRYYIKIISLCDVNSEIIVRTFVSKELIDEDELKSKVLDILQDNFTKSDQQWYEEI